MISKYAILGGASAVLFCLAALAQPPQRSVEERLSTLERQLASLQTQFGVRSTIPREPPESAIRAQAVSGRVDQLERRLEALTADVKRIDQQADAAMREAFQAQRRAMLAEQLARDAASRTH